MSDACAGRETPIKLRAAKLKSRRLTLERRITHSLFWGIREAASATRTKGPRRHWQHARALPRWGQVNSQYTKVCRLLCFIGRRPRALKPGRPADEEALVSLRRPGLCNLIGPARRGRLERYAKAKFDPASAGTAVRRNKRICNFAKAGRILQTRPWRGKVHVIENV